MFTTGVFTSFLLLATFSLASPMRRQTSLCPWNGIPDAANFTLLAVFKSNNSIQKPLAVGLPDPSSLAAPLLGSAESIDSIIAQQFVLADGGITAYGSDGSLAGVSSPVANISGQLSFPDPDNGATSSPAEAYCALFNTSPHGAEYPLTLAVNGDGVNFSLCQSTTSDEFIVIYNSVNITNSGYNAETCVAIFIPLLPVVD